MLFILRVQRSKRFMMGGRRRITEQNYGIDMAETNKKGFLFPQAHMCLHMQHIHGHTYTHSVLYALYCGHHTSPYCVFLCIKSMSYAAPLLNVWWRRVSKCDPCTPPLGGEVKRGRVRKGTDPKKQLPACWMPQCPSGRHDVDRSLAEWGPRLCPHEETLEEAMSTSPLGVHLSHPLYLTFLIYPHKWMHTFEESRKKGS